MLRAIRKAIGAVAEPMRPPVPNIRTRYVRKNPYRDIRHRWMSRLRERDVLRTRTSVSHGRLPCESFPRQCDVTRMEDGARKRGRDPDEDRAPEAVRSEQTQPTEAGDDLHMADESDRSDPENAVHPPFRPCVLPAPSRWGSQCQSCCRTHGAQGPESSRVRNPAPLRTLSHPRSSEMGEHCVWRLTVQTRTIHKHAPAPHCRLVVDRQHRRVIFRVRTRQWDPDARLYSWLSTRA